MISVIILIYLLTETTAWRPIYTPFAYEYDKYNLFKYEKAEFHESIILFEAKFRVSMKNKMLAGKQ